MFDFFDVLDIQVERAKLRANKIFHGQDLSTKDGILALQFWLARHYNVPLFSPVLQDRDLEELVLEIELIKLSTTTKTKSTSDLLNSNKEEAESLFDDWVEQDMETPTLTDKDKEIFTEFKKTGKFL